MRYQLDDGCPVPSREERRQRWGRFALLWATVILVLVAAYLARQAEAATASVYWRVDLNQGSGVIAHGQGSTEQAAWDDCIRLQSIVRAMTAAETRRSAVGAVTAATVRWCNNPKRYATVSPDPVAPPPPPPPPPPTSASLTFKWTHDGLNTTAYRIQYWKHGDIAKTVDLPGNTVRSAVVTDVSPGTWYGFVSALHCPPDLGCAISPASATLTRVIM